MTTERTEELHIVFDGPPGHESGRFVECETPDGRSVNAGEWHERDDGLWELRIPLTRSLTPQAGEGVELDLAIVRRLVNAAQGLSHGTDWNNGTHAKKHGYRAQLLDALPAAWDALERLESATLPPAGRVEELREALAKIAAPHSCDNSDQAIVYVQRIARTALNGSGQ